MRLRFVEEIPADSDKVVKIKRYCGVNFCTMQDGNAANVAMDLSTCGITGEWCTGSMTFPMSTEAAGSLTRVTISF